MNIGVIGTGALTKTMLGEFQKTETLHCTAICSRREETGRAMGAAFGISRIYTALRDMLADPDLDLIYIASPNSLHYGQAKAALLAGKNVLCEKPFVPTAAQADELIALAKERQLLLYEAITTAHHPHYALARSRLPELGDIRLVLCTFCQYSSRYPDLLAGRAAPVFDPAFAGGALMDINLYNVHFAVGLFGAPQAVHYYPHRFENGIDTDGLLVLEYPGFLCQCTGAKDCAAHNLAQIVGTEGRIELTPSSSNCQTIEITLRGREPERRTLPDTPWHYELAELEKLLAAADRTACYAALETTRAVVAVLEAARRDAGLPF